MANYTHDQKKLESALRSLVDKIAAYQKTLCMSDTKQVCMPGLNMLLLYKVAIEWMWGGEMLYPGMLGGIYSRLMDIILKYFGKEQTMSDEQLKEAYASIASEVMENPVSYQRLLAGLIIMSQAMDDPNDARLGVSMHNKSDKLKLQKISSHLLVHHIYQESLYERLNWIRTSNKN